MRNASARAAACGSHMVRLVASELLNASHGAPLRPSTTHSNVIPLALILIVPPRGHPTVSSGYDRQLVVPFRIPEAQAIEVRVAPLPCEKLRMRAGFDDRTLFDDMDRIGMGDGMEPV